jgi:hypothetical protein
MALMRPTYCGVENIMIAYDSINGDCQYYFSVWHGQKDIAFQYVGEDARKAREYLESNLKAMEQSGNDNLLYLKFHPLDKKTKYINSKTDVIANTPICVIESENGEIRGVEVGPRIERDRSNDTGYNNYKMRLALEELPTRLDAIIEEKLTARLSGIEDEEIEPIEPVDPVEKYIGIISGIASNPQIMGIIGQVLNFLKPQPVPNPGIRINGMAMTDETKEVAENQNNNVEQIEISEEILNEALGRLSAHCRIDTDLLLLADMADNDPAQFKFLLSMLRKK